MRAQVEPTTGRLDVQEFDSLVGQLLWGFVGTKDDLELVGKAAARGRLGGVWLLPTEMRSPADAATIINWLQGISPVPLLIGVDAEAGMGLVMGGATELPTAMAIGATRDPRMAYDAGRVTAEEAASCGINAVAAPVLDVNVNPRNPIINTRAYGGDPALVAEMGLAFIEGVRYGSQRRGVVLPIGKHFPGHGDTTRDSHLELDVVDHPAERLHAVELMPFMAAIDAGIPMLMTAHVAYPAFDPVPNTPATLSRPILTDLLRTQLGFQGAVVTDCMNMHAVARNFETRAAAVDSVLAGNDLVLTDRWEASHEALTRAILEGHVSDVRLQQATDRVRRLKQDVFGPAVVHPPLVDVDAAQAAVRTHDHARVAERIAAASITLVDGTLPPPTARPLIIATRMARRFGAPVEAELRAALAAVGWHDVDVLMVDPFPDTEQASRAVRQARDAGWAALLQFNRVQSFDPESVLTSDDLVALAGSVAAVAPLTVVSMGTPYALPLFATAQARLCAYSTCDASLHATLRVLMGLSAPAGRLPVSLDLT